MWWCCLVVVVVVMVVVLEVLVVEDMEVIILMDFQRLEPQILVAVAGVVEMVQVAAHQAVQVLWSFVIPVHSAVRAVQ